MCAFGQRFGQIWTHSDKNPEFLAREVKMIECAKPNPLKDRYGKRLPPCAKDRLGLPLDASGQFVTAVNFAPGDQAVLSAGKDGYTRLWDLSNGEKRLVIGPHKGAIQAAIFSPDARYIVTAGHVIEFWDASCSSNAPDCATNMQGKGKRRVKRLCLTMARCQTFGK